MSTHHGSTLESLFDELGEREEVAALAAKKVLAIQAHRRMKELGLTSTQLAKRMHTSRNQVLRCLDQNDAGITLKMLFRLSAALETPLTVVFAPPRAATRRRTLAPVERSRIRPQRRVS